MLSGITDYEVIFSYLYDDREKRRRGERENKIRYSIFQDDSAS